MGLPEVVGDRVVSSINANGDERIEHDEFLQFFLDAMMGTKEQKMMVAFNVYDLDNDGTVSLEEVKYLLRHLPLHYERRFGISFGDEGVGYHKNQYLQQKWLDGRQIDLISETVFSEYPDGMYFDEFVQFAEEVSSEFVLAVFDSLYQYVPCVKNFLLLKNSYQMNLHTRDQD
jgi:hypothetical protein